MLRNRIRIVLASLAALILADIFLFGGNFILFGRFTTTEQMSLVVIVTMAALLVWAFRSPSRSKRKRVALTAGLGVVLLIAAFIYLLFVALITSGFDE